MLFKFHFWLLLFFALCAPAWSATPGFAQVASFNAGELRRAVEAHRAEQREEVKREESAAGRHLTAGELAELREQVRRQSTPGMPVVPSHMQDTRRNTAPSTPSNMQENPLTPTRKQRP